MRGEQINLKYAEGVRKNSFYHGRECDFNYMEHFKLIKDPDPEVKKWEKEILLERGIYSVK